MAGKHNTLRLSLKFLSILTVGLILRLINLNQSFWLDEAISALIAQKPFPYQWTGISGDFQPPLYYLFLHFFMRFGVNSEWFLRIPSVIFGLLTIIIIYKLTEELFNKKVAAASSLILATSQFHVYYSQELRMYSLLGLLVTLSMWSFYKKRWFLVTLFNILALYTNYMAVLLIVSQAIWVFYEGKKDFGIVKKWFVSLLAGGIFYSPWLPNLLMQYDAAKTLTKNLPLWSQLSALPLHKLPVQIFLKFTLGRIDFYPKILYGLIFGFLLILYGYIIWHLKNRINKKTGFILNWFITPLAGSALLSFFVPVSGVWRLIFILPPFAVLVALSLNSMKTFRMFLFLVVAVNLTANFLYWIYPQYQRENWRDAVSYLEREKTPAVFIVEEGFAPYQWYKSGEQMVCGPKTLDRCLTGKKLNYVSYLSDLFDSGKTVENKIKENGYKIVSVNNFEGVGFIYSYDKK